MQVNLSTQEQLFPEIFEKLRSKQEKLEKRLLEPINQQITQLLSEMEKLQEVKEAAVVSFLEKKLWKKSIKIEIETLNEKEKILAGQCIESMQKLGDEWERFTKYITHQSENNLSFDQEYVSSSFLIRNKLNSDINEAFEKLNNLKVSRINVIAEIAEMIVEKSKSKMDLQEAENRLAALAFGLEEKRKSLDLAKSEIDKGIELKRAKLLNL